MYVYLLTYMCVQGASGNVVLYEYVHALPTMMT